MEGCVGTNLRIYKTLATMTQVGLEFVARDRSRTQIASFTRSVQRMGRQILTVVGVGTGIYALDRGFKAVIKSASDAQETASKFNVVFGRLAGQTRQWATQFGDSVGRATQDVEAWLAGLQDTFVPLGVARTEAAELSKALVKLAVDVGSFNNQADAAVIRDFTSALVGNHEAVRKYGIIITESALKQEALRKGIYKSYKELTDLEKVQLRYSLIQRGTTDAQGDAIRTADDYANQLKRLNANFTEFKTSIGEKALPALSDLFRLLNENKEMVSSVLVAPLEGFIETIKIIDTFKDLINDMQKQSAAPRANQNRGFGYAFPQSYLGPGALPEGKLEISPRAMQRIAEMRAYQRREEEIVKLTTDFMQALDPAVVSQKELGDEQKKAHEIAKPYIDTLNKEIAITGRVGEAHWHAAKMVEFETKLRESGLDKTAEGIGLIERYKNKLVELEEAQRLAKMADEIGDSFAMAFERAVLEGEKLRDVLNALARDIARSVLRNLVTQPIAMGISGAIGGAFGMEPVMGERQFGGAIPRTGLYRMHAGEHVMPAGGGMPSIIVNNNMPPGTTRVSPAWDGEKMIINIESALADRINRGAGALAPLMQ